MASPSSDAKSKLSLSFNYAITHVFFPVQFPESDDHTLENDLFLTGAVLAAAHSYTKHLLETSLSHWHRTISMLHNLQLSIQSECPEKDHIISQLQRMQGGDILAFFIRTHNAAVIFTRREDNTLCESFTVVPNEDGVEATGSLVCSYPRLVVEISNQVFDDMELQYELASFLSRPDVFVSDRSSPGDTQYIIALFGMLRGVGDTVDIPHITKRVRHDIKTHKLSNTIVWRRSPLWLLIRIIIQMSLERSLGRGSYKEFMLFFISTLAMDPNHENLPNDLLHLMECKIVRRLTKLGSSTLAWLSEMALKACARLRQILDTRWGQPSISPSFRNPSQDELARDSQISHLSGNEYIRRALSNPGYQSIGVPFNPNHRCRGSIDDFLSSHGTFFEESYETNPDVAFFDVSRSIEQGIDDWVARVTNVGEACTQLGTLLDKYIWALTTYYEDGYRPEHDSTKSLAAIELFLAIDKLVIGETPLLADYSPEIPIEFPEGLFLRTTTSLHRLSCAYQYLSARHSSSHPGWSMFSNKFTEDSFPARYYDRSPHLQRVKARIERDAVHTSIGLRHHQDDDMHPQSPLPVSPLQAKVVVFELQCPAYIRIWRSAAFCLLEWFLCKFVYPGFARRKKLEGEEENLLAHSPELRPYFAGDDGPPLGLQVHFSYFYPRGSKRRNSPTMRYALQQNRNYLEILQPPYFVKYEKPDFQLCDYKIFNYIDAGDTSCLPNDVLADQVHCPMDFSLEEFIALAQLRGCGSLQWFNILHGLRNRALNLHRYQVHHFLSYAVFQVGPLDLNTGEWIWHQELENVSFCNALMDELYALFVDFEAESIDAIVMGNISLLLSRILASSPHECVSERAIHLLRNIRSKTLLWVEELTYNLAMAPTNAERSYLLLEMAVTCRCTFEIDPPCLPRFFRSAEDVDAALSCALFICALRSKRSTDLTVHGTYLTLLLQRDQPISLTLEGILSDVILADPSEYGIDLAVHKLLGRYQPCTNRWEQSQPPNDRWLSCKTELTLGQPSQTMHFDLLTGTLQVDGKHLTGLPLAMRDAPEYKEIFRDQGFIVIPSNLPGMDFMTHTTLSKHKVHYSLQDHDLVVRVQSSGTRDILQLIPSVIFREALPTALVDGHIHWLNMSSRVIEIRPLEHLWEESSENWMIDCTNDRYRIYKGRETLVDTRSPTWSMVSLCFESLTNLVGLRGESRNLLVTASPTDSLQSSPELRLSVALPHYGLSFFVNPQGELESRDFKDMVYDDNQSIEALFGLVNLLVLRPKRVIAGTLLPEALIPRRVLVPDGIPRRYDVHRVRVNCSGWQPHTPTGLFCHVYDVDPELGCLIGNGNLISIQYLASLHAATSCDTRPDPLTSKTGAQVAYDLLRCGGCRSVMRFRDHSERFSRQSGSESSDYLEYYYPQIDAAYCEIRHRYYWAKGTRVGPASNMMQRAAHLFSSRVTGPNPPVDADYYSVIDAGLELQDAVSAPPVSESSIRNTSHERMRWQVTFEKLLADRPVPLLPTRIPLLHDSLSHRYKPEGNKRSVDDILKLESQIFSSMLTDLSFQQEYLTHLHASSQCVRDEYSVTHAIVARGALVGIEVFRNYYIQCNANYMQGLNILKRALAPPTDMLSQALNRSGQWPQVGAIDFLRCLASASPINISPCWKTCLISFALLLLDLQRSRRLFHFALYSLEEDLSKELASVPCDGWSPEEYPDWLLIQIQGNFAIRRAQAETAIELMTPQSGENTVMQVNMGEGKSSVIIPIAAAALADGKQLVRVVVPQALTIQMFDILVSRLGGLANRPIYYLPFSRNPEYGQFDLVVSPGIDDLQKLMSRCMAERGILLLQPEHVVSLRLMNLDEQLREQKSVGEWMSKDQRWIYKCCLSPKSLTEGTIVGNMFRWLTHHPRNRSTDNNLDKLERDHSGLDTASKWFKLQKWVLAHCRDILDESDEILHARFQLIYTVGAQQHTDGHPHRWTIVQHVLQLVKGHAHSLSVYSPRAVEYKSGPQASFPYIHIVRPSDVGRSLTSFIAGDVMAGQIPGFNFQNIPPQLHDLIHNFIFHDALKLPDIAEKVEEYARSSHQSHLWSGLLLLRGLLASDILVFALSEWRWRVNYGLQINTTCIDGRARDRLNRSGGSTMLAMPYRAKDTPAPNTQFGHPDITIILTCLSYYYTGLTEDQLRTSFEILLDEDDPSAEYARWVRDYDDSLPKALRELGEINLRSSEQWDKVTFPLFARNQATVDFYLSRVVFPKEAKEFPWKLSGSSWDLAEKREKLVTGFSGTNDNRWLLPTSITQYDLEHQKGANASVLGYLLQPENDCYEVTCDSKSGGRRSTREFLEIVANQTPEIRVLLDVGAQVLDLSNQEVARAWLDIAQNVSGAVYFNQNNELMVLTQEGITLSLLSSPLSQTLERCVVYLDHAHTRGTDLKFPNKFRAAVTLGPKVTKDNLVQGCMRMRKLGHTHSVMFFAPPDVDRNIRAVVGKQDPNIRVATLDVICWAIRETWIEIRQWAPHWAQQGMSHKSRYNAWARFSDGDLTREELSIACLQPERKSLSELYGPGNTEYSSSTFSTLDPGIRQRCEALGVLSLSGAQLDEKQEREVNREREREREVELPPEAEPAEHFIHPDVETFVKTGVIPPLHSGSAFQPVFTSLQKSTAATRDADVWSPFILATTDFCRTIEPESTQGTMDQYLRPVQWVLTRASKSAQDQVFVLLSPFEVHELLPDIRVSKCVHLHLYAPRTSQRMKPSDDLKFYTIPPLPDSWTPPWNLIDQLNVFAGQLYLRDYQSYLRVCRFLGVPTKDSPDDTTSRWNLFNIPGSFEENEIRFSESPLPTVMALLGIRSKGRPFAHTHMGRILQGQALTEKDFQGSSPSMAGEDATRNQQHAPYHLRSEVNQSSSSGMERDENDDSSGSSILPSSTGK